MREIININNNWVFAKQGELPEAMPTDWESVNLPHSWNAVDGQDGGNDYYRGKGCYVKTLNKSELAQAEQYYLEIRGANSSADVYYNGKALAHHDGGYSTWRVNLSDVIEESGLLCIVVDNAANETVYPQMADFTFYGGLYRDVNILCVPKSHFDLDFYGAPGLKVTPQIAEGDAQVEVEVYLTDRKEGQSLRYTLTDATGAVVATAQSDDTKALLEIKDVHLWQAQGSVSVPRDRGADRRGRGDRCGEHPIWLPHLPHRSR